MRLFARWIEHPQDVTIQCLHDADPREHLGPSDSATNISAPIAACHSAASYSAYREDEPLLGLSSAAAFATLTAHERHAGK
jgi:hypothetical protein